MEAHAQRLLEQAQFHRARSLPDARQFALDAVTLLNDALKAQPSPTLKQLALHAIAVYSSIKNDEPLTFDARLTWLTSLLNGNFYPPIDPAFPTRVTTANPINDRLALSTYQQQQLHCWTPIKSLDWSLDGLGHIYQDLLQDCSFVTALISLARNNGETLLQAITPHAPSERYGVTLNFNGCRRLVEVGNELPVLKDAKSLFIKSRTNESLYWPALLEKAYLKLKGHGYNAHGSNTSIDTYILSGWIPDFITATQGTNLEDVWSRVYDGFHSNRVVLALGTGPYPSEQFEPNHDYAITDMIPETRSVVIKNPWMKSISVLKFVELFDHFDTLYLNWNPSAFTEHKTINCIWNNSDKTVYHSPQVHIRNDGTTTSEVKLLLEKHQGASPSNISVNVYQSNGEKLFAKTVPLSTSMANNTGFHISSIVLAPGESCTAVISNDSNSKENFTLHTYTNTPITLERATNKYPTLKTIEDEWNMSTCGGNWSHQSYVLNPQYSLILTEDSQIDLALFTSGDTLINAQLFFDSPKPFTNKPSIINEKYQPGQLHTSLSLHRGKYKLVLSTYEPDIHAKFKLYLSSSTPLELTRISTRLGLFTKPFTFDWKGKNRFRVTFTAPHETNVRCHLYTGTTSSSYRPKIRASLFYKDGTPIQINEEFDDCLFGIWTDVVRVEAKKEVVLLCERFEIGQDDVFGEIGSDCKIELL